MKKCPPLKFQISLQAGNAILEMILFLPLALAILFIGTDLGLSALDKAILSDAVRETSHTQINSRANANNQSVYQVTADGISINTDLLEGLSQSLADRLASVSLERRLSFNTGDTNAINVRVTPVRLSIDEITGKLVNYTKLKSIKANYGNANLSLGPNIKKISDDEFLNQFLTDKQDTNIHAIPAPIYGEQSRFFLPESLALLITVEANSPSINPTFLKDVLNSNLGIQIQDLHVLRN